MTTSRRDVLSPPRVRWPGTLAAALIMTGAARAEPYSVRGFVTREASGFVLDEPLYDSFLEEVIGALRPRYGGTGRTTGAAGVDLSLGFDWAPVTPTAATWRAAYEDGAPSSLMSLVVAARKGLPGGLELGVDLAYAPELELASPTLALRWAVLEGHRVLPDIGVSLDVGAALGNPDSTILHTGVSLVVGRRIPVQGLFTLGPYAGYAFRFGRTLDRQVALFDGAEAEPFQTVLPGQNLFLHHGLIGLRVESLPLAVTVEANFGTTNGLHMSLGACF